MSVSGIEPGSTSVRVGGLLDQLWLRTTPLLLQADGSALEILDQLTGRSLVPFFMERRVAAEMSSAMALRATSNR